MCWLSDKHVKVCCWKLELHVISETLPCAMARALTDSFTVSHAFAAKCSLDRACAVQLQKAVFLITKKSNGQQIANLYLWLLR